MKNDSITVIARIFDLIDENKTLTSIHEKDRLTLESTKEINKSYYNSMSAYRSFRHDIEQYISKHDSGELTDTEFINDIKRAAECLRGCDEKII